MNKRVVVLVVGVVIVALISIYFISFKTTACDTVGCFEKKAAECDRAKIHALEDGGTVTFYKIKGESRDNCELYVKIVETEDLDAETASTFQGKDMTCKIPVNKFSRMTLEEMGSDLDYCSGTLKEEMYSVLVKRLYKLVLDDMGLVLEEVERVIG
tara:strand:+ start:162 stop:629 length:468 start_codon:yes stop_codon:yes gene_type:complete